MKLNILGTEYSYELTTDKKDAGLSDTNGYCDIYEKRIAIETEYNENMPGMTKNTNELQKRVKRHECIHAFLFESGMRTWAEDESFVDWMAVQFPKLLKIFQQIEAI